VELQLVLEKAGSFFDQARIDAQSESFERSYSLPEAMDVPLLESALAVRMSPRSLRRLGHCCCAVLGAAQHNQSLAAGVCLSSTTPPMMLCC